MTNSSISSGLLLAYVLSLGSFIYPAFSQNSPTPTDRVGKRVRICSPENLEVLTTEMLQVLPGYANRASQRGRRLNKRGDVYSYMVVAGRPEFIPLPLNPSGISEVGKSATDNNVEQVFFTTLERQYTTGKPIELQQFHWLFLTKTNSGWRKVRMFSQTGYAPGSNKIPTPPRDSSDGKVGQAVDAWLRDCRARSVVNNVSSPTPYSLFPQYYFIEFSTDSLNILPHQPFGTTAIACRIT